MWEVNGLQFKKEEKLRLKNPRKRVYKIKKFLSASQHAKTINRETGD